MSEDHHDATAEPPVRAARHDFRVLTQTRGGYSDGVMFDVLLQVAATGNLVWSQTFTDQEQAREFEEKVSADLDLDGPEFRRRYSVPSSA